MTYDIIESPIGRLTICVNEAGITGLHIEGDRYFSEVPKGWHRERYNSFIRAARTQLAEYFAGRRTKFDLPLAPEGTKFQQAVWKALSDIPKGKTTTYADVADKIGKPKAARAVGTAVGRNPICIILPCHRVMSSDGSLGGYVAGVHRKQKLLELEGVVIT